MQEFTAHIRSIRGILVSVKDYVTVAQAAEMLGLKPETIRWYIRQKRLEVDQITTRVWLIPKDSVERLRNERKGPGRPRKPITST